MHVSIKVAGKSQFSYSCGFTKLLYKSLKCHEVSFLKE